MQPRADWFDLEINPDKLPRAMTRKEWRQVDQWRRQVRRGVRGELREFDFDKMFRTLLLTGNLP